MSPSLKYLMVSSIAARNASSDPMSLTATLGVELACVLLVMCWLAPDADRDLFQDTPDIVHPKDDQKDLPEPARADHGTPGGRQPGYLTRKPACQATTTERTTTRRSSQDMRAGSKGQSRPATIRPRCGREACDISARPRPSCGRCRRRRPVGRAGMRRLPWRRTPGRGPCRT